MQAEIYQKMENENFVTFGAKKVLISILMRECV